MTTTLIHRRATLPAPVTRDSLAGALRVGRAASLATSLVRLRVELDEELSDLRTTMQRLDGELKAYMWAHLTPGLTEDDIMAGTARILSSCECLENDVPTDVVTLIRARLEDLALAALQGWSDRLARTAATR